MKEKEAESTDAAAWFPEINYRRGHRNYIN